MRDLSPIEWAVRPLKKYAVFRGRAPRAEYWWFYLATIIVQIPLTVVDKVTDNGDLLSTVFSFAILLPWLAVTVRRLHDTDRSGWWLLAFFGGFAVFGLFAVFGSAGLIAGTSGSFTSLIVAILVLLVVVITLLVFMVLPGTPGPNSYGPDPYGPDSLEEVFA